MNKKAVKEYLLCVLGAFVVAVGVYFFKFPNSFSTGGVSGISVVLGNYFHLSSASTVATVINLVMLALGFVLIGRDCGVKTVIGTLTLSGSLMLLADPAGCAADRPAAVRADLRYPASGIRLGDSLQL